MGEYWVYENWTVQTSTIHYGSCSFCNHGAGTHGTTNQKNGRWHGPLPSTAAADELAQGTGRSVRRCGSCKPI
jgi:hypothetical protein